MTPPKQKGEVVDTAPALQFSAHKMPDEKWNADIYTVSSTGPLLTGHLELLIKTRMHSSRMRTVCLSLLLVCGGVPPWRGVSLLGGGSHSWGRGGLLGREGSPSLGEGVSLLGGLLLGGSPYWGVPPSWGVSFWGCLLCRGSPYWGGLILGGGLLGRGSPYWGEGPPSWGVSLLEGGVHGSPLQKPVPCEQNHTQL